MPYQKLFKNKIIRKTFFDLKIIFLILQIKQQKNHTMLDFYLFYLHDKQMK